MKQTSPHIFNTSSKLLGLCFVVLISVKLLKLQSTTIIDELAEVCIFIFMTAFVIFIYPKPFSKVRTARNYR